MEENFAKDNFWMTKDSVFVLAPRGAKPARTMEKTGDKLISDGEKVEGIIVYFLPKDKSGKLIGTPKRYLHIWKGGATNKFIDADNVVPYYQDIIKNKAKWISLGGSDLVAKAEQKLGTPSDAIASNFTALDDINSQMNSYGFNSNVDLSNMDGLDDSILNSIGSNFCGDNYSNMINENLLNGLTENTSLLNADGKYSNLINQNLLSGLTENTSLLSADGDYSNMINENLLNGLTENTSLLSADGEDEEVSNAFGDWFKRNFRRTPSVEELYKDASTLKVADPKVDIVEAKVMEKAYKESGSKKPLRDWINSDSGKSILSSAAQLATIFLNQNKTNTGGNTNTGGGGTGGNTGVSKDDEIKETTILGMSPLTFGIVSVGLIVLTSIVAVKVIKSK
jgi:hypothetical protein